MLEIVIWKWMHLKTIFLHIKHTTFKTDNTSLSLVRYGIALTTQKAVSSSFVFCKFNKICRTIINI